MPFSELSGHIAVDWGTIDVYILVTPRENAKLKKKNADQVCARKRNMNLLF